MSRVTLILLLALAVLAVAWGFSHLAPPESDAPSAVRAPRRVPAARTSGSAASPEAVSARVASAPPAAGDASTRGSRSGLDGESATESSSGGGAAGYPAPLRDLFSYADERVSALAPAAGGVLALTPSAPAAPEPTPTPRPVRLVGFVRQAGQLRAALRVHGDVVLAAPGERAGDYAVITLDEDAGIRLRAPDGAEFTLHPER